eukprot:6201699-Pleurochrysis_carterae.AAC.1
MRHGCKRRTILRQKTRSIIGKSDGRRCMRRCLQLPCMRRVANEPPKIDGHGVALCSLAASNKLDVSLLAPLLLRRFTELY